MALVGSNVGLGKSIIAEVPVLLFALLRFLIAIVCLSPWYRPARMRQVSRGEWINLFLMAFFGTFMFTLLMLGGVRLTSAMAAGVITSTIPATVAILSWLWLRERLSRRTVFSVLLAVAGIAVLNIARGSGHNAATNSGGGSGALIGNLMILGAVVCESIYVILSRRLSQTLAAIEICAYTHLIGGADAAARTGAAADVRLRQRERHHLGDAALVRAVGQRVLVLALDEGRPPCSGATGRRVHVGAASGRGALRHRGARRASGLGARRGAGLRARRHRAGQLARTDRAPGVGRRPRPVTFGYQSRRGASCARYNQNPS
jgi:multidrug transporter EmrE-like cation transporter